MLAEDTCASCAAKTNNVVLLCWQKIPLTVTCLLPLRILFLWTIRTDENEENVRKYTTIGCAGTRRKRVGGVRTLRFRRRRKPSKRLGRTSPIYEYTYLRVRRLSGARSYAVHSVPGLCQGCARSVPGLCQGCARAVPKKHFFNYIIVESCEPKPPCRAKVHIFTMKYTKYGYSSGISCIRVRRLRKLYPSEEHTLAIKHYDILGKHIKTL